MHNHIDYAWGLCPIRLVADSQIKVSAFALLRFLIFINPNYMCDYCKNNSRYTSPVDEKGTPPQMAVRIVRNHQKTYAQEKSSEQWSPRGISAFPNIAYPEYHPVANSDP